MWPGIVVLLVVAAGLVVEEEHDDETEQEERAAVQARHPAGRDLTQTTAPIPGPRDGSER